jgi:hypothetical protein
MDDAVRGLDGLGGVDGLGVALRYLHGSRT